MWLISETDGRWTIGYHANFFFFIFGLLAGNWWDYFVLQGSRSLPKQFRTLDEQGLSRYQVNPKHIGEIEIRWFWTVFQTPQQLPQKPLMISAS
jgi:hypothetical protein